MRKALILLCAVLIIVLQGCGKNQPTKEIIDYKLSDTAYEWEGGPLTENEITSLAEYLSEKGISPFWQEEYELSDNALVKFCAEKKGDSAVAYILSFSFDKKEWHIINAGDPGETGDGFKYNYMGSVYSKLDGGICALVYTDEETRVADIIDTVVGDSYRLETEALEKPEGNIWTGSFQNMTVDRSGNIYEWLSPQSDGSSYVMYTTRDGGMDKTRLVCRSKGPEAVEIDGWIRGAVQKDKDSMVFFYGIDRNGEHSIWDAEGSKQNVVFPKDLSLSEYYIVYSKEGSLILLDYTGIWEVSETDSKKLLSFVDSGYKFSRIAAVSCGDGRIVKILAEIDGEPVVLSYDISKRDIPINKKEIVVAMDINNAAFNRMVADFNRYDDEYRVTVITADNSEETESLKKKIQFELSAGKGPDLLADSIVSDVPTMIEKGFFKQLDEELFMSSGCIETALETGMYNGGLYGIPYEFSLDFAAFRKSDVGNIKKLTVKKFMDLAGASDRKYLDASLSPAGIIVHYALYDESNTDYIDWDKHKSKLTEKPFRELIAFVSEFESSGGSWEQMKKNSFAKSQAARTFSLSAFKDYSDELGEYVITGYPRNDGYGIYMTTNRLYLSSQSKNEEGAVRFLRYIVSEHAQGLYAAYDHTADLTRLMGCDGWSYNREALFPIHRVILEQLVKKEDGNNPDNQIKLNSGEIFYTKNPLSDKQKEELWFMVYNALPATFKIAPIENIFYEELEPYFDGEYRLDEALDKLDKRVRLYLNEIQ